MTIQKWVRSLTIFLAGVIVGLVLFRWILINRIQNVGQPVSPPTVMAHPHVINDFTFTERNGKPFGLSNLKGSYWIADFVFTRCMGPCPLLTTNMAKLQSEFKDRADLKFVTFTVDPEYDTPKVLSQYADMYGAEKDRWFFLTGAKDKVYQLIQESFQLAVGPDEKDPIQVVHSLSFVLIGKQGEVLGRFNTNEPEMLALLRQRVKELP